MTVTINAAALEPFCGGPRLIRSTGWLLTLLRNHFQLNNIDLSDSQALRNLVWTADIATTKIVIESITRFDQTKTEYRPALIVKRNGWKNTRLGLDQRHIPEAQDGKRYYETYWSGTSTIFCLAGEGGEVEELASEIFRELTESSSVIRERVGLMRFETVEVSEPMLLENEAYKDGNWLVAVTVAYVVRELWSLSPLQ